MSEIIKEFKKGDLLYIDNDGKAEWGYPEGYPYKEGVTIEWDGNTEGLDAVGGMFYRVSDVVLSNEQIKTGFIKDNADLELPIAPMWDELAGAGLLTDDISIIEMVAFVRKDNVSFNGVVFGIAGVYFANKNNHYVTKFTNETIHSMAPQSLPYATTTTPGAVKQMPYLPNATGDAPTAENFNQLVRQLKNAGLMK